MGSGKTSAMLKYALDNPEKHFLYVTPYLNEIQRVRTQSHYIFKEPQNRGEGKLAALHALLSEGKNVATTHALFLLATSETIQLIREYEYTLILDETLDIFREYNEVVSSLDGKVVNKSDVLWLRNEGYLCVSEDYSLTWNGGYVDGFHFSEVKRLAENGNLKCIDNMLYWAYPVEVLGAFNEIYILTYMFEGSMFSSYLNMHGLEYEKLSAGKGENGQYCICDYAEDLSQRAEIRRLIDVYEGNYNELGSTPYAFSVNWLLKRKQEEVNSISNVMVNYKRSQKAHARNLMWTTTKNSDFYQKLEVRGFKYTRQLTKAEREMDEACLRHLRCFVPCTTRATNDYADRTVLIYLLNRYMKPEIEKYFLGHGVPIDKEKFALSEMLQWIWRSAIRNGEPIKVFIPSSRMRNLLLDWLNAA